MKNRNQESKPRRKEAMGEKAAERKHVRFAVEAQPNAEVYVAGTFNNWNPTANRLSFADGCYCTDLLLPQGTHEYKFIVNGAWVNDPHNNKKTANEFASVNDVIMI